MGNPTFPSKSVGETLQYSFNFLDKLQFGEAINGASVNVVVTSGIDPTPSAMLVGAPSFTATTASQDITGGVPGVIYTLVCTVTATNFHNYVKQSALAVVADAS